MRIIFLQKEKVKNYFSQGAVELIIYKNNIIKKVDNNA